MNLRCGPGSLDDAFSCWASLLPVSNPAAGAIATGFNRSVSAGFCCVKQAHIRRDCFLISVCRFFLLRSRRWPKPFCRHVRRRPFGSSRADISMPEAHADSTGFSSLRGIAAPCVPISGRRRDPAAGRRYAGAAPADTRCSGEAPNAGPWMIARRAESRSDPSYLLTSSTVLLILLAPQQLEASANVQYRHHPGPDQSDSWADRCRARTAHRYPTASAGERHLQPSAITRTHPSTARHVGGDRQHAC